MKYNLQLYLKEKRMYLVTLSISLFSFIQIHSQQTYLFTEYLTSLDSLTSEQASRYNKIQSQENYSFIKIVQFGDLESVQDEGIITVKTFEDSICGDVCFSAKNVEYIGEDNYYWYGELIPKDTCKCLIGRLLLNCIEGERFGLMQIDHLMYNIEDLSGGLQVLEKSISDSTSTCGTPDSTGFVSGPSFRTEGCDIDVLFLYTSSASQNLPNVNNTAITGISLTNQALLNSAVSSYEVQLRSVGIELLDFDYDESDKTMSEILDDIFSNSSSPPAPGSVAEYVATRRNATYADLVVLLVDESVIRSTGVRGTNAINFCVVGAQNANAFFTISHEIGHTLGCKHERCSDEDAPGSACVNETTGYYHAHTNTYSHGFLCLKKTTVHTILFGGLGNGNPIKLLNYSNPNVNNPANQPTGVTDLADNARQIRSGACGVANYRVNPAIFLTVKIIGPMFGCAGGSDHYVADGSGVEGPYNYDWKISYNGGISFGNTVSTDSYLDVDFPYQVGAIVVLKVTVTSHGQSRTVFKTIEIVSIHNIECGRSNGTTIYNQHQVSGNKVIVLPNPSNHLTKFIFYANDDEIGFAKAEIIDQLGNAVINKFQIEVSAGKNQVFVDIDQLLPGMYYFRLTNYKVLCMTAFIVI